MLWCVVLCCGVECCVVECCLVLCCILFFMSYLRCCEPCNVEQKIDDKMKSFSSLVLIF